MPSPGFCRKTSVLLSVWIGAFLLLQFVPQTRDSFPPGTPPEPAGQTVAAVEARPGNKSSGIAPIFLPPPPNLLSSFAPATETKPEPVKAAKPLKAETVQVTYKEAEAISPLRPTEPPPPARDERAVKPLRPEPEENRQAEAVGTVRPLSPEKRSEEKVAGKVPPDDRSVPPHAEAAAVTVIADASTVTEGRALLRLLEHGSGPSIEIVWPPPASTRERLFQRFKSCFGMRVALMDGGGGLYVATGRQRRPWELNLDRYSGFVRKPTGRLAADERGELKDIRAHHGGLGETSPVRVFPRRVDALLLGGLRQLVGDDYGGVAAVRAAYRMREGSVLVVGVEADGRDLPGEIDLTGAVAPACRKGGRI